MIHVQSLVMNFVHLVPARYVYTPRCTSRASGYPPGTRDGFPASALLSRKSLRERYGKPVGGGGRPRERPNGSIAFRSRAQMRIRQDILDRLPVDRSEIVLHVSHGDRSRRSRRYYSFPVFPYPQNIVIRLRRQITRRERSNTPINAVISRNCCVRASLVSPIFEQTGLL